MTKPLNISAISAPRAILFDLDGTLVDTAPDFFNTVNGMRKNLDKPALPDHVIREQVSNGGSALARLVFDDPVDIDIHSPEFKQKRQQLLDNYVEHIGSRSHLFNGFKTVLDQLAQWNIAWGIVTNKPRLYTDILLQKLMIFCPVVVCPDDVSKPKPDPEALLKAADDLQLPPQQCWYVGDHLRDIQAGKAANMLTIAATFGYISRDDDIEHWQADAIIEQPEHLIALLTPSF